MADEVINLEGDSSGSVGAVKALQKALEKLTEVALKTSSALESFNKVSDAGDKTVEKQVEKTEKKAKSVDNLAKKYEKARDHAINFYRSLGDFPLDGSISKVVALHNAIASLVVSLQQEGVAKGVGPKKLLEKVHKSLENKTFGQNFLEVGSPNGAVARAAATVLDRYNKIIAEKEKEVADVQTMEDKFARIWHEGRLQVEANRKQQLEDELVAAAKGMEEWRAGRTELEQKKKQAIEDQAVAEAKARDDIHKALEDANHKKLQEIEDTAVNEAKARDEIHKALEEAAQKKKEAIEQEAVDEAKARDEIHRLLEENDRKKREAAEQQDEDEKKAREEIHKLLADAEHKKKEVLEQQNEDEKKAREEFHRLITDAETKKKEEAEQEAIDEAKARDAVRAARKELENKKKQELEDILIAEADGRRRYREGLEAVEEKRRKDAADTAAFIEKKRAEWRKALGLQSAKVASGNTANNINSLIPTNATPERVTTIQRSLVSLQSIIERNVDGMQRLQRVQAELQRDPNFVFRDKVDNAIATKLKTIELQLNHVQHAAVVASKALSISASGMLRLLQVQLIHSGIGNIINQTLSSIDNASKFNKSVAEIQTISQEAQQTTSQWASQLRRLSDAFGLPIADTAAATYEALSNQIAKGANITSFMAEAMTFARVTVSSATDAVNLLSSVINSYNVSTSRAGEISAGLFQLIDLGRVRAKDLADIFGTILPVTGQLAISLDEVNAALAVMTQKGITPETSIIGLKNVVSQLLSPTKEMKQLLESWGTPTGEAAAATFGFQGILEKLQDELKKGSSRIKELFPDLRGFQGIMALLSTDSMPKFVEYMIKAEKATERYKKAQNLINESEGQDWIKEQNKLLNIFNVDIGQRSIRVFTDLARAGFGLADSAKAIADAILTPVEIAAEAAKAFSEWNEYLKSSGIYLSALIPSLSEVSTIFAGVAGAVITASLAQRAHRAIVLATSPAVTIFGSAMDLSAAATGRATAAAWSLTGSIEALGAVIKRNPITIAFTIIAGSIAYATYQAHKFKEEIASAKEKSEELSRALNEKTQKVNERRLNKEVDDYKKSQEEKLKIANKAAADANKVLEKQLAEAMQVEESYLDGLLVKVPDVSDILKRQYKDFEQFSKAIEGQLEASVKYVDDLRIKFGQKQFKISLTLADDNFDQQLVIAQRRVSDLMVELSKKNQDGIKGIERQRQIWEEIADVIDDINQKIASDLKKNAKEMADLIRDADKTKFDRKFEAASSIGQKERLTKAKVDELIKEAADLFAKGFTDQAKDTLKEARSLADKLISAQRQDQGKFKTKVSGEKVEQKVIDAQVALLNAEKVKKQGQQLPDKDVKDKRLELEEKFQKQQQDLLKSAKVTQDLIDTNTQSIKSIDSNTQALMLLTDTLLKETLTKLNQEASVKGSFDKLNVLFKNGGKERLERQFLALPGKTLDPSGSADPFAKFQKTYSALNTGTTENKLKSATEMLTLIDGFIRIASVAPNAGNNAKIIETFKTMREEIIEFQDTQKRIDEIQKKRDSINLNAAPSAPGGPATASNTNNNTTINLTVNAQTTGNPQVDGRTIAQVIRREIRLGNVTLQS